MPHCDCNKIIEQFQQFRQKLYTIIPHRRDAVMDLIDALSSNQTARSPVQVTLNPLFKRNYSTFYKAIQQFKFNLGERKDSHLNTTTETIKTQQSLLPLIASIIPTPVERAFYLFGLDVTPRARPHAVTMAERGFIHQPNTIKGNKPINIGYSYSILSLLPERTDFDNAPWCLPLSAQRVLPEQKSTEAGTLQFQEALSHLDLPQNSLSVLVADSDYSSSSFLKQNLSDDNVVIITRVRRNRVFYRHPGDCRVKTKRRGHPQWYGNKFDLKDESTWHSPDQTSTTQLTARSGRVLNINISCWQQMLMRGTKEFPLHQYPFTLLKIQVSDQQGKSLWSPMWLIAIGQRRSELSCLDIYHAYRQRFDLEHFFRFGKQRLLMAAFQTPEVGHEENWIQLTLLAYIQLWLTKDLAQHLPRPWERYLPQTSHSSITPTAVQRDFIRIISVVGTPAKTPQTRGYSPGRFPGTSLPPRQRHPVLKKDKTRGKNSPRAS
ncbi:hypothetical protein MC7420_2345 [Coleofasciculus chthonoplastes PCC 7420]|uniref:Transposase IS701-like DDE domain-containing protein n=1 Tax=Coleofasciculus chthonoplastes PCC 7420 TaxID=118168 RepID=B4W247_9CYAN|nr:NF041680 family putative transposase [Coleofasciculus chthonoplastes]EDX71679.1 hypothetical protein MC7420_2345 [Coleofasciculus chthonoplastes PCC 7420]